MAKGQPCKDCGQHVQWVPFEVDEEGTYLKDQESGRSIVHKCEHRGEGLGTQKNDPAFSTMPFGKYRGKRISELAQTVEGREYLEWAVTKSTKEWLVDAIKIALGQKVAPVAATQGGGNDDW